MNYTIKIWLFTVITSPFLLLLTLGIIINKAKFDEILASWPMLCFMILYGLVLSIPAMALFGFIQQKMMTMVPENKAKLILSAYSFISVWITFYILDKEFVQRGLQQIYWIITYASTIVLGVWLFKFQKSKK